MDVIEYLTNHIKTDIGPSPIHGVGTFALRDIEEGEPIFTLWRGDTRIYTIDKQEFDKLPKYSKKLIYKSYENRDEYPVIWFRLFQNCYWNLAAPLCFTNTDKWGGNFNTTTKIANRRILAGEELLGNYTLENTIL